MLTNLYVSLVLAAGAWTRAGGGESPLATLVALVEVLGIVAVAAGFLFLAGRVAWGVQQFVATCRERQRAQGRMVEMLREYLEQSQTSVEQLWSASGALSVC